MDNRWETFAKENAEFYIYSAPGVDFATPAGQELFRQSGRDDASRIIEESAPYLNGFERAIEIGCGIGRLAVPMAERFADVIGVDISPTMLRRLVEYSRAAGASNVRGFLAEEPWTEQGPADLVYSLIVFQHIQSRAVIAGYFARIASCLTDDGVCYAQFDTRPRTLPYFGRRLLPDAVLSRTYRKGIRRIRRRPADLRRLFDTCGLMVMHEIRAHSEDHVYLLRARSRARPR